MSRSIMPEHVSHAYRSDVEAYRVALSMEIPSAFVILEKMRAVSRLAVGK